MLFLHFFIILLLSILFSFFFFFNDTATTEIYTLSLHDALPISDEIPRWLKRCDIGVLATRQDTFLDLSFSGKLSEYIIMNKAVICSRLKTIGRYFSDEALAFFEPSNPADLAKQMVSMYGDMARRLRLAETAKREYLPIRWGVMKERYLKVMEHLSGGSVAERESDHNGSNSAEAVCRLSERGRLDKTYNH